MTIEEIRVELMKLAGRHACTEIHKQLQVHNLQMPPGVSDDLLLFAFYLCSISTMGGALLGTLDVNEANLLGIRMCLDRHIGNLVLADVERAANAAHPEPEVS